MVGRFSLDGARGVVGARVGRGGEAACLLLEGEGAQQGS
jgi:hypothetical protein